MATKLSLKERKISAFSRELQEIEKASVVTDGLTESEVKFVLAAKTRGCTVYRSGWPDFLLRDLDDHPFAVEVKHGGDKVSESQAIMFEQIESIGLPVYVWHTSRKKLIPWRRFVGGNGLRPARRRPVSKGSGGTGCVPSTQKT